MVMRMSFRAARMAALFAVCAICVPARAQIKPERLYNGVNRPVHVLIDAPANVVQDLTLDLARRDSEATGGWVVVASAAVSRGRADLASVMPELWTVARTGTHWLQLRAGEQGIGAPVVLQPMRTPERAHLMMERAVESGEEGARVVPVITQDASQGRPMFEEEQIRLLRLAGQAAADREVVFSGLRVYGDRRIVLDTTLGEMEIRLRPDAAPNTAFNFLHLASNGFYDTVPFHRIVPRSSSGHPFVIQAGDPSGTGSGGPGYMIDLEPTTLEHTFGVVSMARAGDPDSNGSQFFICLSREGTRHLDGRYTAFGELLRGSEVLLAIAATPVDPSGRAADPPVIRSVRVIDAPPLGTGPSPVEVPAGTPVER